jgi:hypothetical protein
MDDLLQAEAELPLDSKSMAALKRARRNIARVLARPEVKALLQTQREAIERDREARSRQRA